MPKRNVTKSVYNATSKQMELQTVEENATNGTNCSLRGMLQEELKIIAEDINATVNRSREFQIRNGRRLLACVSRKCSRLQEHYYDGNTHEAGMNKLAHKAMTA